MRYGIIGPTDVKKFCKILRLSEQAYTEYLIQLAEILARKKHELIVVPHKKSSSEFIARRYHAYDGEKVYGIIPMEDIEWGFDFLNQELVDEVINSKVWSNSSVQLLKQSDFLICVGQTAGSVMEICWTKWYKVKGIIVIRNFITSELPKETIYKLKIKYVDMDDLESHIK